jgi:YHS domain-containing protein
MKTLSRAIVTVLALVVTSGLMTSALAQKATKAKAGRKAAKTSTIAAKFLAKGDGIEYCVVTGEKLENKNVKGEFFGREVYFCCADCLAQAQKNPAAYVKKTEAEQIKAVKAVLAKAGKSHDDHHGDHHATPSKEAGRFLGKGDGVETCPVTGEAISKDVSVEIDGRTVYACCPGCLDKIKQNPEFYLKPTNK